MPIDYKEYPANWKTEIRPAVLARANNCCEDCGAPNHAIIHRPKKGKPDWVLWPEGMESEAWTVDGLKSTRIVLTIAHMDHDKSNEEVKLERLKALCQRCHLLYDIKHHISNRKYCRNHKGKHQTKINFE
jgi:hypothetical protein